jgi:hypothetical protein
MVFCPEFSRAISRIVLNGLNVSLKQIFWLPQLTLEKWMQWLTSFEEGGGGSLVAPISEGE